MRSWIPALKLKNGALEARNRDVEGVERSHCRAGGSKWSPGAGGSADQLFADPHQFNADQDPAFHLNADPDLARIWLLIKGMRICDHLSAEPPAAGLHFEPAGLQCERSRFLASKASIFNFNAGIQLLTLV